MGEIMKESQFRKGICLAVLCGCLSLSVAGEARADYREASGPAMEAGDYVAAVETSGSVIYVSMDSDEVLREAAEGEYYQILGDQGDGWLEIRVGEAVGYIAVGDGVSVVEKEELEASEEEDLVELTAQRQIEDERRHAVVEYALQFLGCRYKDGGNDPHTGSDCSGFVRYVMKHGADVDMNRNSRAQAEQGTAISAEEMQPGDLIFYGKNGRIGHVAMYIGDGHVVHSSTYKTGVKISDWSYREPLKITNVLGE